MIYLLIHIILWSTHTTLRYCVLVWNVSNNTHTTPIWHMSHNPLMCWIKKRFSCDLNTSRHSSHTALSREHIYNFNMKFFKRLIFLISEVGELESYWVSFYFPYFLPSGAAHSQLPLLAISLNTFSHFLTSIIPTGFFIFSIPRLPLLVKGVAGCSLTFLYFMYISSFLSYFFSFSWVGGLEIVFFPCFSTTIPLLAAPLEPPKVGLLPPDANFFLQILNRTFQI